MAPKEKAAPASNDGFSLDVDVTDVAPNSGGGAFKRIPFGDFRFKIIGAEQQKSAEKPNKPSHVMLKPSFVVVRAYDESNDHAVGMETNGLYAGSRESPKFMQQRLACLLAAIKLTLKSGERLTSGALIGREFDATVTWELSKPVIDPVTLEEKKYVNSRVCAERPVGAEKPKGIDAAAESREASKWLAATYGDDADDKASAEKPAWAKPETTTAAVVGGAADAIETGFHPESETTADVHEYRAYIALGAPSADQAKEALEQAGFDPAGPIDVDQLTDDTKADYVAKFPPKGAIKAGLPPLGGLGNNKAQKGARSPRA